MAKTQRKTVTAVAGAAKDLQDKAKADSQAIQSKIDGDEADSKLGDPRDESLANPEDEDSKAAQLLAAQAPQGLTENRGRRRIVLADQVEVEPLRRGFNLTGDDGVVTSYEAGTTKMPRAHANHWYAAAHGVVVK